MANEDTLIRKRSAMKAKLTLFSNVISVLSSCKPHISNLQRLELEGRLSKFVALYDEFDDLQMDIEVLSDEPDEDYKERAEFEERYYALQAQARCLLASASANEVGPGPSSAGKQIAASLQNNFIRLPKIDLPHFDGSYQDWLEYRNTFLSLIHSNSCIDNIRKFHYLRASLKGSAQEIIKNIDFRAENYEMAWNFLCERFNNSRLLINSHVQALFNVAPITEESSICLRRLVDTINKNIRALKTLGQPTEHWDTPIVYMMSCKLDLLTSRNWEENRNALTELPTLSQFCTFLKNKADLLETLGDQKCNHSTKLEAKPRSFLKNNKQNSDNMYLESCHQNFQVIGKCLLCFGDHPLYACETFRSLPAEARVAKAKEFQVCLNCLRTGHMSNRCRLSHCKYCKVKHNTLLHVDQHTPIPS